MKQKYYKHSKYLLIAGGLLLAVCILLNSIEVSIAKPLQYILIGFVAVFIFVGIIFLIRFFPHELKRQEEELKRKKEEQCALDKELREKHKKVDWSKETDALDLIKELHNDDGFIPMGDVFS